MENAIKFLCREDKTNDAMEVEGVAGAPHDQMGLDGWSECQLNCYVHPPEFPVKALVVLPVGSNSHMLQVDWSLRE